jgi:hypothetical protein
MSNGALNLALPHRSGWGRRHSSPRGDILRHHGKGYVASVSGRWIAMEPRVATHGSPFNDPLRDEIDPVIVTSLLGYPAWRPRLVGAWLAALGEMVDFDDHIGRLLVRSAVIDRPQ